jgi:methionine-rich copper-binding protein CopC
MEAMPAWHFHEPPERRKIQPDAVEMRAPSPMTATTYPPARPVRDGEPKRLLGNARATTLAAAVILSASLWSGDCSAGAMALMESYPVVNEIMDGSATSFALRFDGPVDHARARLMLVTPAGARPLHARLGGEPNTLFAAVGKLAPGAYRLTWKVRAPDGALSSGEIPFAVAPR